MNVGSTDAVARVQAIQQMASSLGLGATPSSGFASALQSAEAAGGATATPAATKGGAVSGVAYASEINAAATKYGLDPALLAGLVKQESGFNPNATSSAGAKGLTQLMPATARSLGVTDASDPAQALEGGAKYLRQMLDKFGGDEKLALAAYNAGPGAVTRFGGIPPYAETKAYVEKVLANRDGFAASATSASALGLPATAAAVGATTSAGSASANRTSTALALDSSSSSDTYGSGSSLNYPTT
ncbi:MAG: lytic transglycosylase domain-containing protein [Solirubrobacteraceae bacterium]|nr:lytic transglycosylase domain-containing protein [Solirubrobacteraceae bacterium]